MKRRRRIEVTFETERIFAVALPRHTPPAFCERCGVEAEMLTVPAAAARAGLSPGAVYARVEAGELHAQVTKDGVLLICSPSLTRRHQADRHKDY